MPKTPVVLICGNRVSDWKGTPAHVVRDTYVRALVGISRCMPLIIPSIGKDFDLGRVKACVDGILLTGSYSHVSPELYGAERAFGEEYVDQSRDDTALPLVRAAIAADMPVFAICRGFQELNVACGGTLHQDVHALPGSRHSHRERKGLSMRENFEQPAHRMIVQKGGLFEKWGLPAEFGVNSLHTQAPDTIGKGLFVEAVSDDGIIEAASMPGKRFVVGAQWHPEGDCFVSPVSARLFEEFGKALRG